MVVLDRWRLPHHFEYGARITRCHVAHNQWFILAAPRRFEIGAQFLERLAGAYPPGMRVLIAEFDEQTRDIVCLGWTTISVRMLDDREFTRVENRLLFAGDLQLPSLTEPCTTQITVTGYLDERPARIGTLWASKSSVESRFSEGEVARIMVAMESQSSTLRGLKRSDRFLLRLP